MKKKFFVSSAVAVSLMLTGCGNDGKKFSNSLVRTGFYVDSAVQGVDYTCGTQSGVTDKEGKFVFEKGQKCTFSIADIVLREVAPNELTDGKKIVEENIDVAVFLQSIDSDGNPENGIAIKPEIVNVIADETQNSKQVPTSDDLETLVSEIEQKVSEYEGKVVSPEDAQRHLDNTLSKITQEMLGGKTFYLVAKNENLLNKVTFDEKVSHVEIEGLKGDHEGEMSEETIDLEGKNLIFNGNNGSFKRITGQTGEYLIVQKFVGRIAQGGSERLYFNLDDATAYFESLHGNTDTEGDPIPNIHEEGNDGSGLGEVHEENN